MAESWDDCFRAGMGNDAAIEAEKERNGLGEMIISYSDAL